MYETTMFGFPSGAETTVNGQCFMSSCTLVSLNRRPMRRLASNTVFFGFSATCNQRASAQLRVQRHRLRSDRMGALLREGTRLVLGSIADEPVGVGERHICAAREDAGLVSITNSMQHAARQPRT